MAGWDAEAEATVYDLAVLLQWRTPVSATQIMDAVNEMQAFREDHGRPPLPADIVLKIVEPCIHMHSVSGWPLLEALIAISDAIGRGE